MAKTTKKKNRKLKRQIRKTVGALLMVSAITVAAIPVQEVSALPSVPSGEGHKVQVLNYSSPDMTAYDALENTTGANLSSVESFLHSGVPYVKPGTPIYTTGDGMYQFAFVKPSATDQNEVAVILGANVNNLPDNKLSIPASVDAYKKYIANTTSSGYCAVNRSDKFLYYRSSTQKLDKDDLPLFWVPALGDEVGEINMYQGIKQVTDADGTIKYVYTREEIVEVPGTGEGDAATTPTTEKQLVEYEAIPRMVPTCIPCYYHTRSEWEDKEDNELYYWNDTGTVDPYAVDKFHNADSAATQRIHDADVHYIGRQYLEPNDATGTAGNSQSEWKIPDKGGLVTKENKNKGIFAEKGQIVTLEIGDNLLGIGDYAFYSCSGLNSVTFGNGLNTLGNGVFEDCVNMVQCNMQTFSDLSAIGERAFYNCRALNNVAIPVNVRAIGDYCFAGCDGLQTIDLCGQGQNESGNSLNVLLSVIGYNAFENCSSLISVTFPDRYVDFEYNPDQTEGDPSKGIPITYFSGCTSLQFIKVQNSQFTFKEPEHKDNLSCDIGSFLSQTVPEAFYFEGPAESAIHETAKDHSAAFKYLNEDKFEKVVWCPETEYDENGNVVIDTGHECTFIVDSSNRLIDMDIPQECGIVEIPANIGAGHGIGTIGSTSFQNNCFLKKIIIPSTVIDIEDNAFKGCHNLKDVIFSQPINVTSIGSGAFNTQNVDVHKSGCNKDLSVEPVLSFTGLISPDSVPFQYAMEPSNNINSGSQPRTHITFYSGWPTNLTVKYNPDTDKNELINYPQKADLENYVAWDKNGVADGKITYPDMTKEYAEAAVAAYEGKRETQVQQDAANSYLNINLPAGIESIKKGIFTEIEMDEDDNPILDSDGKVQYRSKNDEIESITMNTVERIEPYTFAGSEKLKGFYMAGGDEIDDYAFLDCEVLENVNVAGTVSKLGVRPFAGCVALTNVSFSESPYFNCDNAIIYGLTNGSKSSIIECLETRGEKSGYYVVGPDEVAGVMFIQKEAFMDCGGIGQVDLSLSKIETISDNSFRNMGSLTSIALPDTVSNVESGAFQDNKNLRRVTIPGTQSYIAQDAFMTGDWVTKPSDRENDPGGTGQQIIYLECIKNTTADRYAKQYWYLSPEYDKVFMEFTVYFYNYPKYPDTSETALVDTVKVKEGEDAPLPTVNPSCENPSYVFTGWSANYKNIRMDNTIVYAQYGNDVHQVTFVDGCPKDSVGIIEVQPVEDGKNPKYPDVPEHEGYVFEGWVPELGDDGVTDDITIVASYSSSTASENTHTVTYFDWEGKVYTTQRVGHGEAASPIAGPVRKGFTFVRWASNGDLSKVESDLVATPIYDSTGNSGNNSGNNGGSDSKKSPSPSATPTATPEPGSNVKKYTVSVSGGSGSGQYAAGEIVAVNAYYMGEGQSFDKWTSSTAGVGFSNPNATSATFTMPAANVAVTATYKTGGGSGSAPVTNNGGGGGGSTVNTVTNNGTVVDVNRPGISNTNLAGATVSGATDNFIVKVTEDQAATDAVTTALQARYGDLSRIKYLPMDISLYDSTGRTRIADTSGISVNLTLPLPDDLVQYAGNNRVAAISGGALEDLNARFTTVGGVPCVNFTATHFSPYVIYVDTANLTEATIDTTPKTGDPIHPKWFLAIGLACISLILFFKREKVVINTKAA